LKVHFNDGIKPVSIIKPSIPKVPVVPKKSDEDDDQIALKQEVKYNI